MNSGSHDNKHIKFLIKMNIKKSGYYNFVFGFY